ncbi:MAG: hypothetical protein K2I63_04085, partial [Helicobacter sp.]|nr:hypothetical protein [Helicobacter sp.]
GVGSYTGFTATNRNGNLEESGFAFNTIQGGLSLSNSTFGYFNNYRVEGFGDANTLTSDIDFIDFENSTIGGLKINNAITQGVTLKNSSIVSQFYLGGNAREGQKYDIITGVSTLNKYSAYTVKGGVTLDNLTILGKDITNTSTPTLGIGLSFKSSQGTSIDPLYTPIMTLSDRYNIMRTLGKANGFFATGSLEGDIDIKSSTLNAFVLAGGYFNNSSLVVDKSTLGAAFLAGNTIGNSTINQYANLKDIAIKDSKITDILMIYNGDTIDNIDIKNSYIEHFNPSQQFQPNASLHPLVKNLTIDNSTIMSLNAAGFNYDTIAITNSTLLPGGRTLFQDGNTFISNSIEHQQYPLPGMISNGTIKNLTIKDSVLDSLLGVPDDVHTLRLENVHGHTFYSGLINRYHYYIQDPKSIASTFLQTLNNVTLGMFQA